MPATDWSQKPVTILGLSKSGVATAKYLAQRGACCLLSETVPASPTNKAIRDELTALGVTLEMGGHTDRCFSHSDLVVVSPGIPPCSTILQQLTISGKTIISEVELAYRERQSVPFIAITGTNGKTTTTTLCHALFEAAGYKAPACGNIGLPIIDVLDQQPDYLVAELSSYQLTFSPTLTAKVAIFTNFRPDHLDWHGSLEAYKRAKYHLFLPPCAPGWAILNAHDEICQALADEMTAPIVWFARSTAVVSDKPHWIAPDAQGNVWIQWQSTTPQRLFNVNQMQLIGQHNWDNALSAAAAAFIEGVEPSCIESTVTQFKGVEHRLEWVATVEGIRFYNDSKATNPDATICALAAFAPNKVVLMAGGRDKKTDLTEWVSYVKERAQSVVLLGEAAERFETTLKEAGYKAIVRADSFDDAILKAKQQGNEATPVLFSPSCASFDMFKNFEERGDAFKAKVHQLASTSMSLTH